jgi:predicted RND superfamily exporter protein
VVRFIEYEDKEPDLNQYDLVMKTVAFMVKPCTYTTLTTMVAFLSLIVSGIRPVIDFGWMMTVAVGLALLLGFFILPAGLLLLGRNKQERNDEQGVKITEYFAKVTERKSLAINVAFAVILLFSISGVLQLKVENRFIDYFHESTEIFQGMLVIDQQLGGTLPLDVILFSEENTLKSAGDSVVGAASELQAADDDFDDDFFADEQEAFAVDESDKVSYWFTKQGMEEIQQVHEFLDKYPETGKVLSLATLYQVMKDVSGGSVDDIQLALIKHNATDAIGDSLIEPYLSDDGVQTRLTVRVKETSQSLDRSDLLQQVDDFLQNDMGLSADRYAVSGMLVMYNNMLQSLYRSQIATLAAVFVAIMVMFAILFRSLKIALLAILPNVLAALFVLGGMGWMGIALDIMTITIAAITVGIGVDDTIHYIHRFKREFELDENYIAAMHRSHQSIGKAMFYTSVTIIMGFSILALSNFTPSIYFGLLTGVAMFAALMGALVLLPHLLLMFKPFGPAAK